MRDPEFAKTQVKGIFDPHVAPLNRFVEELRTRKPEEVPYIAPVHGGVEARALTVLRDPGPATQASRGTSGGFLCAENDDQTAETQWQLLHHGGMDLSDACPWNAYPWYINRHPSAAQLTEGAAVLLELMNLLPRLRVVLLEGLAAQDAWSRLLRQDSVAEHSLGITVMTTYHPSTQALWHLDPAERERRRQHRLDSFASAGQLIRGEA